MKLKDLDIKVHHLGIAVSKMDASIKAYENLGWELDGSITDDQALYYGGGKSYVEYPLGNTIGKNWEADARNHGYSITVGEFYITRQDGGEFK